MIHHQLGSPSHEVHIAPSSSMLAIFKYAPMAEEHVGYVLQRALVGDVAEILTYSVSIIIEII